MLIAVTVLSEMSLDTSLPFFCKKIIVDMADGIQTTSVVLTTKLRILRLYVMVIRI
jgi:hypothetical protein